MSERVLSPHLIKGLFVAILMLYSATSKAQNISINEDGSTADPSSILDIKSQDKGLLIPRLSTAQRQGISSPAEGLMVYDTDSESFWYFTSGWVEIKAESLWAEQNDNIYRLSGQVGIGTNNPSELLHLVSDDTQGLAIRHEGSYPGVDQEQRQMNSNNGTSINTSSVSPWTGVSNATSGIGGSFWSSGSMGSSQQSDRLRIDFPAIFPAIPTGAVIEGVQITLRKSASGTGVTDERIQLHLNGNMQGANKAIPTVWPNTFSIFSYGGAIDDWSTNFTVAQFNAGQVGLVIEAERQGGFAVLPRIAYVDWVEMRVHYTIAGLPQVSNWLSGTVDDTYVIERGTGFTPFPELRITDNGTVEMNRIMLKLGAADGRILSSDADGNGTWVDGASLFSSPWSAISNDIQNTNSGVVRIGPPSYGLHSLTKLVSSGGLEVHDADIRMTDQHPTIYMDGAGQGTIAIPAIEMTTRRGSHSNPLNTGANDVLGQWTISGLNGNVERRAFLMRCRAAGNWNNPNSGGSEFVIQTRVNNSNSLADRLHINMNGRIGIGMIANNAYHLQLANDFGTGRGLAHTWATYSDQRIKRDLREIDEAVAMLMALHPLRYVQMNSHFDEEEGLSIDRNSGTESLGFLAQELLEVLPEAVSVPEDPEKSLYTVDYMKLIPLLTKAMQEQQSQIQALQAEVDQLKR